MTPSLTVVIPALNEAAHLPVLLGKLAEQSRRPDAVVVADAGSTDQTRAIAQAAGAIVVDGGKPAAGRNAGAAVATTDLLLFLDADDEPAPDWIERALAEFEERELVAAAGQVEPLERTPANVFACEVVNLYLQAVQYVSPHAPGFCILVRREVHEAIGGFDETLVLAEDHEYVQRAAEQGKFRILRSAPMATSMRRIEKEGLIQLSFKYLYSELYVLSGRPIRSVPFEYEFGAFADKPERGVDAEGLRERLGRLVEPVESLSAEALERLRQLAEVEVTSERIEAALRELAPEQVRDLRRYVGKRLDVARRMPPIVARRAWRKGEALWRSVTE